MRCKLALGLGLLIGLVTTNSQSETLRMASVNPPPSLGNPFTAVGQPVWASIFDTFTVIGPDGDLAPSLAMSWEAVSPTIWRLELREGVTFHNGEPFNAESAAGTLRYLTTPSSRRYLIASELRNVERVEIVDEFTLDIVMNEIDAVLPKRLSLVHAVEPKAWERLGPDEFALKPIGTGPYRLEDWGQSSGQTIIKAVDSGSFRPASVFDEVHLIPLNESATRVQALLSGRVELAAQLSPDDIPILESAGFEVLAKPVGIMMSIAMRTERDDDVPLKDVRVRKALNYAVNKKAIADVIMAGLVKPGTQGVPEGVFGYDPELEGYPYDPEKARALLAEAGYADGFTLNVEALLGQTPNDTLMYSQVIQDLARVGVKAELRGIPFSNFVGKYVTGNWGDVDAFSLTWNAAPFNDAIRPIEYFACTKIGAFFCEPSLTPLIEASNRELNPEEREKLIQEIIGRYNDLAPSIILVSQTFLFGLNSNLENVTTRSGGIGIAFEDIRVAD